MAIEEKEMVGVIDDAIGQEMIQNQIDSLTKQLEMYNNSLEMLEKQRKDYEEQVAVDEEAWQLKLSGDNHEKIADKLTFKYEQNPRFWELVKAKMQYEYRNHKQSYESTIAGFEQKVKELTGQRDSVVEKLAKLKE